VSAEPTMLSSKHIKNLEAVNLPSMKDEEVEVDIKNYRIYSDVDVAKAVCTKLYHKFNKITMNADGFAVTSHHNSSTVISLSDAVKLVPKCYGLDEKRGRRLYLPCYVDKADKTTIHCVVIIHPGVDENELKECDDTYNAVSL
jgi:hypothetical protein